MYQKNPIPARGKLLLAGPFLNDPHFRRSVVLISEHDKAEGSVGFVLNKPTDIFLGDLVKEIKNENFSPPIFIGGPVKQDSLHFIHRIPDLIPGSGLIAKGIYAGTDFEKLFSLVEENKVKDTDLRFFLGYAGWSPEQLLEELKESAWIVSPSSQKFTFSENASALWQEILTSMGPKFKLISNYPEDPAYN